MPIEVKMPRLSDTMEVGTVVKWNVKPGQRVKSGDVVADIETDKATMELQTFDDGTVAQISVAEGQTVPVGTVIMRLAEAGEAVESGPASAGATARSAGAESRAGAPPVATRAPTIAEPPVTAAPNGHADAEGDRVFASPLARKIAAENRIDLSAIHGTGPSGRIVRRDVEAALGGTGLRPVSSPAARARPVVEPSKMAGLAAGPVPGSTMPVGGAGLVARSVAMSNMRTTIAKRLVQSKSTIPHYQVTVSARMDNLLTLRGQLNEQLASQGVKLSVNDFLVRACALAMHMHPFVNSRWREPQVQKTGQETGPTIELLPDINIGVAIALPVDPATFAGGGLVVATLRSADRMGLRQISSQTKSLSEKARTRGLTIEEMSDSTFTISNLGMFGVDHFTAIINPPNTAILAVGAAMERTVVETDAAGKKSVGIGHEMSMTMSSDHRVIDGAMAAQYLATVREFLEKPATLVV